MNLIQPGHVVQAVPLPTAGDNPDGLSTAAAAEGAPPMAPDSSRG